MFFVLDVVSNKTDVSDWKHNTYAVLDTEAEDLERVSGVSLYNLAKAGIKVQGFDLSSTGEVLVTLQTMKDIIEVQLLVYQIKYKTDIEFKLISFENMSQAYRNKGKFVAWLKETFPCLMPLYKRKGSMGFYGLIITVNLAEVDYFTVPWGCLGISFRRGKTEKAALGTVTLSNTIFDGVLSWEDFSDLVVDTLVLPNTLTEIRSYAFKKASIKHIVFSESLSQLGDYCFQSSQLVSVELPVSLNSVGSGAFNQCDALIDVKINGDVDVAPLYLQNTFGSCHILKSVVSNRSLVLENTFADDFALEQVILDKGSCVTKLGRTAFRNCEALHTLQIGNSYTGIDDFCFENCKRLSHFEFAPTLEKIENGAFSRCALLDVVDLSRTQVRRIAREVFKNCSSLKTLYLSPMCEFIGDSAFINTSILSLTVPKTINTIEAFAFAYNSNLKVVEFEDKTNLNVHTTAFLGCDLGEVVVNDKCAVYGSIMRFVSVTLTFDDLFILLQRWSGCKDNQGFPLMYFENLTFKNNISGKEPTLEQKELMLQFIFKYVRCVVFPTETSAGKKKFFEGVPSAAFIPNRWFESYSGSLYASEFKNRG